MYLIMKTIKGAEICLYNRMDCLLILFDYVSGAASKSETLLSQLAKLEAAEHQLSEKQQRLHEINLKINSVSKVAER